MDVVRSEKEAKLRKEKTGRAVALALEGKWEEAAGVNRELLGLFPDDIEAMNRLGKAYLELGRFGEAREAFAGALSLSPYNTIAKKNLERLAHLQDRGSPPQGSQKITPNLFIEEGRKSAVTVLQKVAPGPVLAKVAAGDLVNLRSQESRLVVENQHGDYLGEVTPKLANRLLRLIRGGNQYTGAVVSVHHQDVAVTLREVYTHPNLVGVVSFPSKARDEHLTYLGDAYFRLDLESEREEEGMVTQWTEPDEAGAEDVPRSPRASRERDYEDEDEETG